MQKWLDRLEEDPRQDPSEPIERGHPHAQDSLWLAWLIDADAYVVHAVNREDRPRILHVGRRPPEGLTFGLVEGPSRP